MLGGSSYLHLYWKVPGTNYNVIVPAEGLIPDRPAT